MQIDWPQADEVHIVSDLHLGGSGAFQMCPSGALLARYIRALIGDDKRRRWLVINGDFVDFLAEAPSRTFDAAGAPAKLLRLMGDASFAPVFDALREFVAVPDNRLAIVVGNHDVELALPWVQQTLLQALSGGDSANANANANANAHAGRIVLALDGKGLALRMGGSAGPRVLCLHGNEVDNWNVVDHEAVRKLARQVLRGHEPEPDWHPNAGSRMVVQVMNDIKHEFPLVDLLKPEKEAVVPLLLALKPSAVTKLGAITALQPQRGWAAARMATGFLGDEPAAAQRAGSAQAETLRAAMPSRLLTKQRRAQSQQRARALLNEADRQLSEGESAADQLAGGSSGDPLGLGGALLQLARLEPVEALRQQLKNLDQDDTFDVFAHDDTYRDLDALVSRDIDFLVAGHTHLPRAIVRQYGSSYYFNSGTWARVLRLQDEVRNDRQRFAQWLQALKTHPGGATAIPGLVDQQPTSVVIWADGDGVHGELRRFSPALPALGSPVAHTRYTRT